MKREYFDMLDTLPFDTMVRIKIGDKWKGYKVPQQRKKDGYFRTFGDIYNWCMNIPNFRFCKGLVMEYNEYDKLYESNTQYFYFSKEEPPHTSIKKFETFFYMK